MAALGFMDSDGVDLGNKYVTKEYVMAWYSNLPSNMVAPQLMTWGANDYGQLGNGTNTGRSSPAVGAAGTNWQQIAVGYGHTAAIKLDGTLWLCGYNTKGTLGDNTTVAKNSPVQTISGGANWKQVACGSNHTVCIKTDGTLWSWGANTWGELGDNTNVDKSSPVQTSAGGTTWKQVSSGASHTAAVKTDGTLWCWGAGAQGQNGDNTGNTKSAPVQTSLGGTTWKQAGCGGGHVAAIKTDGTLWTWGYNFNGQLGDNTVTQKLSPVQVITGGINWKRVECGSYHTACIKTDGTLWVWGKNDYGQLGDNTVVPKSSPVQTAAGGTNWSQVACSYSTVAIKTNGTLWVWGKDNYGQLGDNTVVPKSSPVQTAAGGSNWKLLAAGTTHTVAISEASGW